MADVRGEMAGVVFPRWPKRSGEASPRQRRSFSFRSMADNTRRVSARVFRHSARSTPSRSGGDASPNLPDGEMWTSAGKHRVRATFTGALH